MVMEQASYKQIPLYSYVQGGLSSGYKKFISDKNLKDETYGADGVALIRISGVLAHNSKAVQVDPVTYD